MKNIRSNFQTDGLNRIEELFTKMSENSGHNLDQYISGNSLVISDDITAELMHDIKIFIKEVQELIKETEEIQMLIPRLKRENDNNTNNDNFLEWLEGYLYDSVRPYQDAKCLRAADLDKFKRVTTYVFNNMILSNIGNEDIDTEIAEEKEVLSFRKILMTFINRVICYNDNKLYIFKNMDRRFGLSEEKCEFWWDIINDNRDRLWKIMFMKKMNVMEDRLNQLMEYVQEG